MTQEEFLKFEKENKCDELQIDGFYYWWYIRDELMTRCGCFKKVENEKKKEMQNKRRRKSAGMLLRALGSGWRHSPLRKGKKHSLIILQDPIVYNPEGKYYECPPTQSVVKGWEGEKTLIADWYTQYSRNAFPVQFPETCYTMLPLLMQRLYGKVWKLTGKEKKIKEKIRGSIRELCRLAALQYNCALSEEECAEWIYPKYRYWKAAYPYYKRLIKRLKPVGIVEQCYYSMRKLVCNEAAKQFHVPVIELQHGRIDGHRYYHTDLEHLRAFPDYLLLFADFWRRCAHIPLPEERIFAVGYPYLEEKVQRSYRENKTKKREGRTLLVIGGTDILDKGMRKYLLDVCALAKERKITDFHILYKMHPGFTNVYDGLRAMYAGYEEYMRVLRWDEGNLYDCFAIADEQISVSSTGIFEGMAYGLKTWIYPETINKSSAVDMLCREGYAEYAEKPEQMFEDEDEENDGVAGNFWVKDSEKKLLQTIKYILEEGET